MKIDANHKRLLWGAGVVLAAAHFGPGIYHSVHPVRASVRKPSPVVPMVRPPAAIPPPVLAPPPDAVAPLKQLSGVWIGEAMTQEKTSCKLRLELGVKPLQPDTFTGDSTLSCAPNLGMMTRLPVGNRLLMSELQAMKPVSGIFSGKVENGSINLKLDQLIGDSPSGCHPTEFSITPFGQNNLAARWQQDIGGKQCAPGDMIMRRSPR